jgi:nucleotide-binding universal stress UspA family protein
MPGACTVQAVRRRVVAGVDPLDPSRSALLWAQSMACVLDASLDAVAVWDITAVMAQDWVDSWDPERETAAQLSAIVAGVLGAAPPVHVRQVVRRGRPAAQLADASRGAQMLVLGRRRRGGLRRLLCGSVSVQCAAHASCPVLTVPDASVVGQPADDGGRPAGGRRERAVPMMRG